MTDHHTSKTSQPDGDERSDIIDTAHAPHYVVLAPGGPIGSDVMSRAVAELDSVMDAVVGPGQPYCPVIFDLRGANLEKLSFSGSVQVMKRLLRRSRRSIMVLNSEQDDTLMTFFKSMTGLLLRMEAVHSLEEALALLEV